MRSVAFLLLAGLLTSSGKAQSAPSDPANLRGERVNPLTGRELPIDQGAAGLAQQLRRLRTRASLMLIVAHPDDEDGGMLTLYARGQGARVATLTLTRGEGGQNAMTGDFEDALGLIRTQELLAADRYFGADQMFGTEVDFGFSKTKEEAFRKWTHQRVLYDAVRAVRLYRPLVLAAVFVGGVTDGHGQHQVSGEITQEVFKAAADPNIFPELTREGILPWAPLKVYARVPAFAITDRGLFDYATNQYVTPHFTNYVTGQTSSTPPTPDVVVHEGETDPLLTPSAANSSDLAPVSRNSTGPFSYVQFARIGLGLQRTQIGPGVRLAPSGAYDIAYHRYGSRLPHQSAQESSFFDGIDTSLAGIASLSSSPPAVLVHGLAALNDAFTQIASHLDPANPSRSAPALVAAQHDLGAVLYGLEQQTFPGKPNILHELRIKQAQLNDAIVTALGLKLEIETSSPPDVPEGTTVGVKLHLTSASTDQVGVFSAALHGPGDLKEEKMLAEHDEPVVSQSHPFDLALTASRSLTAKPTLPYFSRTDVEQPTYQVSNPALRNAPATPPPLTVWLTLRYHQTEVQLGQVLSASQQALAVVPTASVSLPSHAEVLTPAQHALQLKALVLPSTARLHLTAPSDWTVQTANAPDTASTNHTLEVHLPAALTAPVSLQAIAEMPGQPPQHDGYRAVGYAGLPRTNFYTPATLKLVPVDLTLPKRKRIAYLPGTGDAVADTLASVGFEVTRISVADLTPERLGRFDTVVLGVRTYNAHPDLHGQPTQALLDFARAGGNVVVQYQSAEFTASDAPYPLALGNSEKVVDENTPVELLDPKAPALSYPNQLRTADFSGWIEERGHGFLQSWDPKYTALTETHDPGAAGEGVAPQLPQRGGLITTALGKGHWTYCAFALYRQLPEAVPGAYRLFTDLIGLADATP